MELCIGIGTGFEGFVHSLDNTILSCLSLNWLDGAYFTYATSSAYMLSAEGQFCSASDQVLRRAQGPRFTFHHGLCLHKGTDNGPPSFMKGMQNLYPSAYAIKRRSTIYTS